MGLELRRTTLTAFHSSSHFGCGAVGALWWVIDPNGCSANLWRGSCTCTAEFRPALALQVAGCYLSHRRQHVGWNSCRFGACAAPDTFIRPLRSRLDISAPMSTPGESVCVCTFRGPYPAAPRSAPSTSCVSRTKRCCVWCFRFTVVLFPHDRSCGRAMSCGSSVSFACQHIIVFPLLHGHQVAREMEQYEGQTQTKTRPVLVTMSCFQCASRWRTKPRPRARRKRRRRSGRELAGSCDRFLSPPAANRVPRWKVTRDETLTQFCDVTRFASHTEHQTT